MTQNSKNKDELEEIHADNTPGGPGNDDIAFPPGGKWPTVAEGEDVVFEPNLPADDELVITEHAAAEQDIKAAVNVISEVETGEKRYGKHEPIVISALEKATSLEGAKMRFLADKLADEEVADEEVVQVADAKVASDGSTASYYELPENAEQLQDLISHRNMNAQLGEIFRECYRYGLSSHCDELRGAKKIKFYIDAEIARLEKLEK